MGEQRAFSLPGAIAAKLACCDRLVPAVQQLQEAIYSLAAISAFRRSPRKCRRGRT